MDILFVNLPFSGHTNPTLPLAAELVRRGHSVAYINAEEFRGKIEQTGAGFIPYADYPEHPSEQKKKTSCFRAAFDTAMGLERHFDLLIYEMFFYPGIEIARRKGIPCVRQFSQPAWSENTWKSASKVFRFSAGLIDAQVMGGDNKAHMGLEHRTMTEMIINSRPELNIVYVPQAFQKNREDFGDDFVFAIPPSKSMSGADIPYGGMKRPIVYISLGSIISNKGFCRECIRAFGGKDMSVILNTGRISPDSLGSIPDNIYAYSFVPQTEVLSHADVFLTHCGMNSVNEALTAGVPMVAMPFINDQTENAARLVSMGLAKRVRSFPSRGKELYEAVDAVSRDSEMKSRASAIKAEIAADSGFERLAELVENII